VPAARCALNSDPADWREDRANGDVAPTLEECLEAYGDRAWDRAVMLPQSAPSGIVNLMDFTSFVPVSGRRGLRTFNSLEASMMHSIAPTCLS
jgi:hypothetical protein